MSTEERVERLEEEPKKLTEPKVECFFCIDRTRHNFWHNTTVTDKLIREYFEKDGIVECNHEKITEASIWFADFVASALLHFVIDNHIERQTDVEFLDKTVRNETIMIPAMEKRMKEQLEEFPLEKFDESIRGLIKAKHDLMPRFIEIAKEMYQKNVKL